MNVSDLKTRIEDYRVELKAKGSHVVHSSDNGPIGMSIIDAIVSVLENSNAELKLSKRLTASPAHRDEVNLPTWLQWATYRLGL